MKFGTDILQTITFQENLLDILNLKNSGEIQDGRHLCKVKL